MKKELKDDIIRLRLTAEAKQHFSELCERVGSSPSNILRQYIHYCHNTNTINGVKVPDKE